MTEVLSSPHLQSSSHVSTSITNKKGSFQRQVHREKFAQIYILLLYTKSEAVVKRKEVSFVYNINKVCYLKQQFGGVHQVA